MKLDVGRIDDEHVDRLYYTHWKNPPVCQIRVKNNF